MSDAATELNTLFERATAALKAGQVETAIRHYEAILAQVPDDAATLNNLAIALRQVGQLDAAIRHYETLIRLQPDSAVVHFNLGNAYHDRGDLAAAIATYQKSLALEPLANTYVNLGLALYDAGDSGGAIAAYEQALRLNPDLGHAHTNLGMTLLMEGQWQRGWQEWRWKAEQVLLPTIPTPHWDGSDLRGKTLLLHTEGGFGDTLQFIRYAPLLAKQGARLGLVCPSPLQRLLQTMPALDWLAAPGAAYPPVDAHTLLLSLPKYLGTTLETIPTRIPYLSAPIAHPALPPAPGTRLKVGVTWASGAYQGAFLKRFQQRKTCPLAIFADLFTLPDVSFYSLQVGQDPQELAALSQAQGLGDRLHDLKPQINDFADTAAWIEQLDLVIAVDTSVVHLAGALGKPTWVLLPYACDWRWGRDRADTPWYPTLRLFRQPAAGDWPSVIATVKAALQQWQPPAQGNSAVVLGPTAPPVRPSSPASSDDRSSHLPSDPKTLFQQGTTALQSGDWETAIRCYQAILAVKPQAGAVHHNLAVALRLQGGPGNLAQAIDHFQRAIALQTPTAGMHYNLANALREAQDWSAAIAQYQAALQLQPNYPEATLGLGRAYLAQGDTAAAIALYEAFLDQRPDDPDAHAALSEALAAQGEPVAAAIAQRQAERLRQRHTVEPTPPSPISVLANASDPDRQIWLSTDRDLDLNDLKALFEAVGWPSRPLRQLKRTLQYSFQVAALWTGHPSKRRLIGFARLTTDQVFNATLWDVMVHPDYQGQGWGKTLVRHLMAQLADTEISQITLFANPNVVDFYRRLGFVPDPDATHPLVWYRDQPHQPHKDQSR